jgi:hypothetical protein
MHTPTWPKTFAIAFGVALVVVLLLQVYVAAL